MPNSHKEIICGGSPEPGPAESPLVPTKINNLRTSRGVPEALYVATDCAIWVPQRPEWIARDCQINGRCYRRLDPEYFAWLRGRMHAVKVAADAGRVAADTWDELRRRFNEVQARAIAMFGEPALLDAIRTTDPEAYRPPMPEEFEKPRPAPLSEPRANPEAERLARARELVDGIRDRALALGWTADGLHLCDGYERRPFAARYGLVCYIGARDRIGEVARGWIEVIGPPPAEIRARFYNPDVEQP